MTVKTRRMLFYALFFLFIIFGSAIVAYSLGIRLDFKTFSLKGTGAIYLKSEPPDTYIFLDGRQIDNQTGLLQSGTLIDNLAENSYHIILKKDGYFNWEKEIKVQPSLVKVFDSIALVPKTDPEWLTDTANGFRVNGGKLAIEKDGKITVGDVNLLGNKIEDFAGGRAFITYNEKTKIYYLADLLEPNSALNVNALFNSLKESRLGLVGIVPIVKMTFHPFNYKKIIVQSRGALYNLDTTRLSLEQIQENVKDFRVKSEEVLFYDAQAVYRYNLIFRTKTKVMELDGENGAIKDIWINSPNETAILFENGKLVLTGSENLDIADKAEIAVPSNDGKFIAFADYDGPIYIYRVDKKGSLKLDTGIDEEIADMVWYKDDKHLFIKAGNKLYFTEVDDDLPLNTIKLSDDMSIFEYQGDTNFLYFSTPQGIYRYKLEM